MSTYEVNSHTPVTLTMCVLQSTLGQEEEMYEEMPMDQERRLVMAHYRLIRGWIGRKTTRPQIMSLKEQMQMKETIFFNSLDGKRMS